MTVKPDFLQSYVFMSLLGEELDYLNMPFIISPPQSSQCSEKELLCCGTSKDFLKIQNIEKVIKERFLPHYTPGIALHFSKTGPKNKGN